MSYKVLLSKCEKGIFVSEEVIRRMLYLGFDFEDTGLNISYADRLATGQINDLPRHDAILIRAIEDCHYFGISPTRNDSKWQIQLIDKPMYRVNIKIRSIDKGEFLSFPDPYHYVDSTNSK